MTKPGDSQTKKTLHELAKEFPNKTYRELEKYRDADRQGEAGVCIMGEMRKERENKVFEKEIDYHRYWKNMYEEEHKLRQEAEGETTIVKGIGQNSPEMKAAKAKTEELQNSLGRLKKENNELYNRIADLTEATKSKDYFRDPDYKFLIEENCRLEQERNELLAENKKLHAFLEKRIDGSRKSGM